jgi:hypothetical protein
MPRFRIDPSRLENARPKGMDIISACPACRENGKDRAGNNLRVFPSGAFHCIAHPKEREHNRRVLALVGIRDDSESESDFDDHRAWKKHRIHERLRERDAAILRAAARKHRAAIIRRHSWSAAEVWEDSPQRIDDPFVESDSRHFLASLFPGNAILWAGAVHHSGTSHARCWKTCSEWQLASEAPGPMTTPATWKPGIHSRNAGNVLAAPYTVLDFDGFDGVKPATPDDLEAHLQASLAMIRWLREGMDWSLAAIIWTGSKSLHAWFHAPPADALQSLRNTAADFGIDAGLIGSPAHPCRLPGQRHEKTGGMSRVIWLAECLH